MGWSRQPGGVLEKQMNGVLLELDPGRRRLRIVVTDYHARPVDIDLAELQNAAVSPAGRPEPPCPGPQLPARVPEEQVVTRYVPTLVAGAVVAVAIVLLRWNRPGEE